jgi:hypothetical protein
LGSFSVEKEGEQYPDVAAKIGLKRQQVEITSRIAAIDALDLSIPHAEEDSALMPTGIGHQIKNLRLLSNRSLLQMEVNSYLFYLWSGYVIDLVT